MPILPLLLLLCASSAFAQQSTASAQPGASRPAGEQTFLYRVQPARLEMLKQANAEEIKQVGAHWEYLKKLYADGVILFAGRTTNDDESSFGIVVFRAKDEAAGRAIMEGDPAVKNGVMKARLFPYKVALPFASSAPR